MARKRPSSRVNDRRGNYLDRRARRAWMLTTWNPELGPWCCRCVHCGCLLDNQTMQVDRIIPGGSYRRTNIQPSCRTDNRARGNDPNWVHPNRRQQHQEAA